MINVSLKVTLCLLRRAKVCGDVKPGHLNTIILLVCPSKFSISNVLSLSWDLQWSREKLKTMIIVNFGLKANKEYYGIFDNGLYLPNWRGILCDTRWSNRSPLSNSTKKYGAPTGTTCQDNFMMWPCWWCFGCRTEYTGQKVLKCNSFYYMSGCVSRQYEANSVFWLATQQAGWASVLPYNRSFIDQACTVKEDGPNL